MGWSVYARPDELAGLVDGSPSTETLLAVLGAASRQAEGPYGAGRTFWVREGARTEPQCVPDSDVMSVPDLLSVSEVRVQPAARYYTAWADCPVLASSAYLLLPEDAGEWPKTQMARVDGLKWPAGLRTVRITGEWGYGDGRGASPWGAAGVTGTVASASGNSLTLSAAGAVLAGHTIKLGGEQMFVWSVSSTTATVVRGIHGTTAAAHSAADVSVCRWPEDLTRAVLWIAAADYRAMQAAGVTEFQIGDYRERRLPEGVNGRVLERILGRLRRGD